jgi:hypothetical protein
MSRLIDKLKQAERTDELRERIATERGAAETQQARMQE